MLWQKGVGKETASTLQYTTLVNPLQTRVQPVHDGTLLPETYFSIYTLHLRPRSVLNITLTHNSGLTTEYSPVHPEHRRPHTHSLRATGMREGSAVTKIIIDSSASLSTVLVPVTNGRPRFVRSRPRLILICYLRQRGELDIVIG